MPTTWVLDTACGTRPHVAPIVRIEGVAKHVRQTYVRLMFTLRPLHLLFAENAVTDHGIVGGAAFV
jgi:hypothetical protein